MKRMKRIIISLAMVALSAQSLFALEVSLGASGWYNWWRPAWHEGIWRMTYYSPPATTVLVYHVRGPRFFTEGDFFGGPSLSVRFLER
ncbi:MAG: hypothetical protein JXA20_11850 [Spirochaetes bacterium]|nr:hypothetical protein [Spirochaetota bacterium]